jgi:hypothetical protein
MRFVGGRLSKQQDATIRTSVATIGIAARSRSRRSCRISRPRSCSSTATADHPLVERFDARADPAGLAIIVTPNGEIQDPFFPTELLDRLLTLLGPPSGSSGPGAPDLRLPTLYVPPDIINPTGIRQILIQSRPSLGLLSARPAGPPRAMRILFACCIRTCRRSWADSRPRPTISAAPLARRGATPLVLCGTRLGACVPAAADPRRPIP